MPDYSSTREIFWKNIDESYYKTNTYGCINRRKYFARLMAKNKISSVLELGCNTGGNLLYIMEKNPGIKAVGIDICENAINYGKEVEKNLAEMFVGSIYDLSRFEDKSFDVVFTMGVLMHINLGRAPGIIKEMKRIATRYIINIEKHGQNKVLSYGKNSEEHAFSHNFIEIYRSFGLFTNIAETESLVGPGSSKGGANHIIWANLNQKDKLVLLFEKER